MLQIADQAEIFRDGALVAMGERCEIDIDWIISHMVGRAADDLVPDLLDTFGDVALSLRGISTIADPSNPARLAVNGFDLDVREGEIVCLYGLMGAGRTELLESLAGRVPLPAGLRPDSRPELCSSSRSRSGSTWDSRSCPRTASAPMAGADHER